MKDKFDFRPITRKQAAWLTNAIRHKIRMNYKNPNAIRRLKAITKGRHWHHVPGTIAPNFYHFKY